MASWRGTRKKSPSTRYVESLEQQALFGKLSQIPYRDGTLKDYCYAIPNAGISGGRRAMLAGARRKAEGVTAGVSDVECMIAAPPYHGLYIEMKRPDGVPSDVSKAQREFMDRARACGRKCEVAFGWEHAWKILIEYVGL